MSLFCFRCHQNMLLSLRLLRDLPLTISLSILNLPQTSAFIFTSIAFPSLEHFLFSLLISLSSFKHLLKNVLWSYFLNHFDPDKPCSFHYLCPCIEPVHTLRLLITLLRLLVNSSSPTETQLYFPVPYVLCKCICEAIIIIIIIIIKQ